MPAALLLALSLLEALPALITASEETVALIENAVTALRSAQSGRDPTSAEWAALHAQIAALQAKLGGVGAP